MNLDFYCIGSSKCGTSTLHDILKQHPQISLPSVKETKFLSLNYQKGLDWYYKEYFKPSSVDTKMGEIYPCLGLKEAPSRLLESYGENLKLFAILRDPVTRLHSNYLGQRRIGKINTDFETALIEHPILIENSLYFKNLSRFLEKFPKGNLKVYLFERDFISNKSAMLDDLCDFLSIEKYSFDLNITSNSNWKPKSKLIHKIIYKRPKFLSSILNILIPSKQLRQKLRVSATKMNAAPAEKENLEDLTKKKIFNSYFREDIKKLEQFLGLDLSMWYKHYDIK